MTNSRFFVIINYERVVIMALDRAKEYLKKVLNNVEDVTDNDWLVKLKNLPSGGIKGLVHFKIKKIVLT